MPQYLYPTYQNPFVDAPQVVDTVQTQLPETKVLDSVVPSFITEGFGRFITPLPRVTYEVLEGWNLALLGVIVLLIVLNKQLYPRQFRQVLSVPGGVAHTNQLLREWSPTRSFLAVSFLFSYGAIMALFVQKSFVILTHDVQQYNGLRPFGIFCAAVAAWIILRYLVLRVVGWLFGAKDVVDRQMAVQLSASTFGLIIMVPVALLLLYNPYSLLVWVGVGVAAAAALMRFIMEIVETKVFIKIPAFYIFLYFCALEIAPVATLVTAGVRYLGHGSVF